ncbi:30S ribosomal protein S21 [candidate division WWE3 bacterium]|uniref:30S ribosomal protein S21 n=1 Tax=candidate division WWE3 bacterium TaxID=2053526 RepID=A0A955LG72_UNCKA|nr:30S ribosomal protein S21 [candidate division WWE3 bacterium]
MVVAKPNETSEQLLRRFNREVRDLNLMDEIRDRLEYEKPSQRRKREKRERAVNLKRYRNE